jgi:hypothetical protein
VSNNFIYLYFKCLQRSTLFNILVQI